MQERLFGLMLVLVWTLPLQARDLNNNGLSDVWEARFNVAADSMAKDPDADGFTNFEESRMGTDPQRAGSALSLTITALVSGQLRLEIGGVQAKVCQLESSADLHTWVPAGVGVVVWDTSEFLLPAPVSSSVFFRCRVVGDLDEDGDGLSAWEEWQLGSGDDDGTNNGLPDWWELRHFGYAQVDSAADPDRDGLSNLEEFAAQSSPVPQEPLITLEFPAHAKELQSW